MPARGSGPPTAPWRRAELGHASGPRLDCCAAVLPPVRCHAAAQSEWTAAVQSWQRTGKDLGAPVAGRWPATRRGEERRKARGTSSGGVVVPVGVAAGDDGAMSEAGAVVPAAQHSANWPSFLVSRASHLPRGGPAELHAAARQRRLFQCAGEGGQITFVRRACRLYRSAGIRTKMGTRQMRSGAGRSRREQGSEGG